MNVVVLGAASGIALEIERIYAARGCRLGLLARNTDELQRIKQDLLVRGASGVETMALDLAAASDHLGLLREIASRLGGIDIVLVIFGTLGDQRRAKMDLAYARTMLDTNFASPAMWMLAAAEVISPNGTIAAISSVAGDRGRKSNFVYGAAKGALALFAQGMAHDSGTAGPHVLLVKPGFVVTPMTDGMNRSGPLWASAKAIAQIIVTSIDKRRGPIVYAPWFWRWIMLVIRSVPARVFHKTNL